jgi:hypothetical protein
MATLINSRDKALQTARYRRGATQVTLTAPAGAFIKAKNGAAVTPGSIKITATKNDVFTAAATYSWQYALSTKPDTYTTVTSGGVAVTINELIVNNTDLVAAIGTTGASEVYYKCTVSETKLDTASSIFKIIYSKESDDPITVNMTKTNVSVPCDQYGTPSSLAGTGTTITVVRGSTPLGYNSLGGALANTFTVTTTADATRTLGGTTNSTATSYVLDDLTALAADQSSTVFTITIYDGNGTATNTFSRTLAYTKVKNGLVGQDSTRYFLQLNTPVIAKSSSSAVVEGVHTPSTIVATGKTQVGSGGFTNVITNTNGQSVTVTLSSYTQGTPVITGPAITTTSGLEANKTYYVAASTTASTTVRLATNLANANAGTAITFTGGSTTIANGSITVGSSSSTNFGYVTITPSDGAESSPSQYTQSLTITNSKQAASYTVKLYADALKTILIDSQTIPVVYTGSSGTSGTSAISLVLTNDNVSIPTASDGTNPVYTGSGTDIIVYEGSTQLTYAATGTTPGTYKISSIDAVNITAGSYAIKAGSTTIITTAAPGSITADTATITYNISGITAAGTTFTIAKTQSLKKLKAGSIGVDGKRSTIINAYRWLLTAVTSPDQTFTYTWATGAVSAYPTGWTASAGAAPGDGYTLYQLNVTINDLPTVATTSGLNWSVGTQNIIGFRKDGTIGELSAYTKTAYITLTTATPPSTPAATTGASSLPAAVGTVSWTSASPGTVPDGSYVYISTGIYGPTSNQVVWAAPYLSYFKVGSLSAISASLGAVGVSTTGNIHSGTGVDSKTYADSKSGFFLGYASSAYKMEVGSSTSYLRFDGTTVSATGMNIYTADNQDILTIAGGQEWSTVGTISKFSAVSLQKTGVNNITDAWAYSNQFYTSGAAVSFQTGLVNKQFEVGLDNSGTNPGADTTINYSILLSTTGVVYARVEGYNQASIASSHDTTDVFLIAYDNKAVYYYINGVLKYTYTSAVAATQSYVAKIVFTTSLAYAKSVKFTPWGGVGADGKNGTNGTNGDTGPAGTRAPVTYILAGYETLTDAAKYAAEQWFTTNYGGLVLGDRVTVYNTSTGKSETRNWLSTNNWQKVDVYIDGNLLVKGSITSDALALNLITVGQRMVSQDGLFVVDLQNKYISISV